MLKLSSSDVELSSSDVELSSSNVSCSKSVENAFLFFRVALAPEFLRLSYAVFNHTCTIPLSISVGFHSKILVYHFSFYVLQLQMNLGLGVAIS